MSSEDEDKSCPNLNIKCLRTALDVDHMFWYLVFNVDSYCYYLNTLSLESRTDNFIRLMKSMGHDAQPLKRDDYYYIIKSLLDPQNFTRWTELNYSWRKGLDKSDKDLDINYIPRNKRHIAYVEYIKHIINPLKMMLKFLDDDYHEKLAYEELLRIISAGLLYEPNNFPELLSYGICHDPRRHPQTITDNIDGTIYYRQSYPLANICGVDVNKNYNALDSGKIKQFVDKETKEMINKQIMLYNANEPYIATICHKKFEFNKDHQEFIDLLRLMIRYC